MIHVLVTDGISTRGLEALKGEKGLSVDVQPPLPPEMLKREIGKYQVLVVRSATKVRSDVIDCASQLELIIRAGIGVDNIDVDYATEKGILVANTPHGNATTAAEHTFALIASLARYVPQACGALKQNRWEKKAFMGSELKGKTLGVIGLGNIGAIVVRIAKGYLMNVLAYDPFVSGELAEQLGAQKVTFEELISTADVITLHTPLNDSTRRLIDATAFEKMKSNALLINCARGGVVDESALALAVTSGRIAGAAVDVFEKEPAKDHPFFGIDRIVVTPHLGASTKEAQESVAQDAYTLLKEYAKHRMVSSAINSGVKFQEVSPHQQVFVTLAQKLGALQGQLLQGSPKKLIVEVAGNEVAPLRDALMANAALAFLQTMVGEEKVNSVNVRWMAKKRGLSLVETHTDEPAEADANYQNLVRIRVVSQDGSGNDVTHVVAGTAFDVDHIRLTELDGYELDVIPRGHLLLVYNEDRPGIIGRLGTFLGQHDLNISRMAVTLQKGTKLALAVYTLEKELDPELVKEIATWDSIHMCHQVYL